MGCCCWRRLLAVKASFLIPQDLWLWTGRQKDEGCVRCNFNAWQSRDFSDAAITILVLFLRRIHRVPIYRFLSEKNLSHRKKYIKIR